MKEQLKLLEELQRHDARLQEMEAGLKTLPEKLQADRASLAQWEARLEKERQDLADSEKFRRELEMQLKIDESNVAKAKTKMQAVKTGKDYMAAQREVEATRKMISDREEEILKLGEAIEASRKKVEAHEQDVAQLRELVAKQEEATAARMAELKAQADGARVAREEAAAKVQPAVLKRYGTIRLRKGLAVVPVKGGVCQGCHMAIPPQLYRTVQRGQSLETCPTCNRIIYWDQLMLEEKLERGES